MKHPRADTPSSHTRHVDYADIRSQHTTPWNIFNYIFIASLAFRARHLSQSEQKTLQKSVLNKFSLQCLLCQKYH